LIANASVKIDEWHFKINTFQNAFELQLMKMR